MEACKLIDVDITQDQISKSHRSQTKKKASEKITSIISRVVRNQVFLFFRKLIRSVGMKRFFKNEAEHFYFNEILTKFRNNSF